MVAASVAQGSDANAAAHALAEAAEISGFDRLVEHARQALEGYWLSAGTGIESDPALQLALRFNMFHIFQSASRTSGQSIAAKGLTGEGYEGHYFWHTEALVLPALALPAPQLARHLIEYRLSRLDDAREHTRAHGHTQGGTYP